MQSGHTVCIMSADEKFRVSPIMKRRNFYFQLFLEILVVTQLRVLVQACRKFFKALHLSRSLSAERGTRKFSFK